MSEFLATPVTAALMAISPWIPFLAAVGVNTFAFILGAIFIPKTLDPVQKITARSEETQLGIESFRNRVRAQLRSLSAAGRWMREHHNSYFLFRGGLLGEAIPLNNGTIHVKEVSLVSC
jgi:hypothetical protein